MYSKDNQLLFCPGPVNVAQSIWQSLAKNTGHREEEFSKLLIRINKRLLQLYQIKKSKNYYPVLVTGSGTAANESVLSSIVGDRHVLVLTNGEFGERLYKISAHHNKHTHKISFDWGEKIDLEKVEKYLGRHKVDIIVMVHHETSTGMINPVELVGKLVKKYKLQFFVDTVSSIPVDPINLEKCNVTFCSTSSGKAIGSLPGLGIVIGRIKAFEQLKGQKTKTVYLNLYNLYRFSKDTSQTPNTPAVHLFYALDQALANILKVGVDRWRKIIEKRALRMRYEMHELGLEPFLIGKPMSSVLTTFLAPNSISVNALQKKLKEKGIVMYPGKGPLIGKVFQIGNIGEFGEREVMYFIDAMREILQLHKTRRTLIKTSPIVEEVIETIFSRPSVSDRNIL